MVAENTQDRKKPPLQWDQDLLHKLKGLGMEEKHLQSVEESIFLVNEEHFSRLVAVAQNRMKMEEGTPISKILEAAQEDVRAEIRIITRELDAQIAELDEYTYPNAPVTVDAPLPSHSFASG